jgi:hypothetical protein
VLLTITLFASVIAGERYDDVGSRSHAPRGLAVRTVPMLAGPHTIFVNFDGVTLEGGAWNDDATADRTVFPDLAGEWPAFGDMPGSAKRGAVLAAVRADFDRFGVVVTDERPATGLYTMVVVSPRGGGGSQLGVANVACGGSNLAGLAFAFFGASESDTTKIAATISHEAGHSLGLDHTSDTADLMFPTNQGGDPSLVDGCAPLEPGALCTDVHAQFCPSGQQNGVAELTALLGTGEIDTEGPALEIVSPTDGDRFAVGDVVTVEVEATDDIGVEQVKLYRGDTLVGTDIEAPYAWTLEDLDEGVVELRAEGIDVAGQHAESDVVAIAVGDAELPEDDAGGSDDGGVITDAGEVPEQGARDVGCGCRHAPTRTGWLAIMSLAFVRRRSRAAARGRRA